MGGKDEADLKTLTLVLTDGELLNLMVVRRSVTVQALVSGKSSGPMEQGEGSWWGAQQSRYN